MQPNSLFPTSYFSGSDFMKKEFLTKEINNDLIKSLRSEMDSLIESASISDFSKEFCKACFAKAPDEFFYMPTSSTGKYHGGPTSEENSCGGNIKHTKKVLNMAPKVLHRYKEVVDDSIAELLKVSCILHDICKIQKGEIYNNKLHGENGAELIEDTWTIFKTDTSLPWNNFISPIEFAVANHMYLWRFQNVMNQLKLVGSSIAGVPFDSLVVGLMLSECDYYATPFGVF